MRGFLANAALVALLAACVAPQMAGSQPGGGSRGDWWGPGWMGPGHMWGDRMGPERWRWDNMGPVQRQRVQRHWTYMNEGVPAAYRGARNPLRATPETLDAGADLYANNCARCHGSEGLGDGEAGRSLVPSPAVLTYFVQMPMAADEYLFWAISEGGERFGTDMPAFGDDLSETEIWQIITYMRAGFPET